MNLKLNSGNFTRCNPPGIAPKKASLRNKEVTELDFFLNLVASFFRAEPLRLDKTVSMLYPSKPSVHEYRACRHKTDKR